MCHWLCQCRDCVLPLALAKPVAHTVPAKIMSRNFRSAYQPPLRADSRPAAIELYRAVAAALTGTPGYQRITPVPQARPAPNPLSTIWSPRWTRPA